LFSFSSSNHQDGKQEENLAETLLLKEWRPETIHQVPRSNVSHAAYRAVDVHSHAYTESKREVDRVVESMDSVGVQKRIVLTGATGDKFKALKERYSEYPDRFDLWCGINYSGYMEEGWPEKAAAALERCAEMGGVGIGEMSDKGKGLVPSPDPDSQMHPNDPRMDPVFEKAAELGLPVNIHIAEPIWMYQSMDSTNDGLLRAHTWSVEHQDVTVSHSGMIDIMEETLQRHPGTTFIACHLMNLNNNLARLGDLLDRHSNLYIDIGARYAEFGTIPRYAARFFEKYQDRILYGTDYGFEVFGHVEDVNGDRTSLAEMYRLTFRVLETTDDHFYRTDLLGYRWPLYGLGLSDPVLRKIYQDNAQRILDL
jgi:predicted TIM-barrel fold metal-dependent hydrolase